MEDIIGRTLKALERRNIRGWYAQSRLEARETMLGMIPEDAVVGIGDSSALRQIGIIEELEKRGTNVINPFDHRKKIENLEELIEHLFKPSVAAALAEVFLAGTNALTEDGRLLNIDNVGNRVSGMVWGHPRVIIAVGKNKIVKDLEEALQRVKNVIVPEHTKKRGASGPPCSAKGKCYDCLGKKRVCNVTTIIEGSPGLTELNVVIVDEDLGLGWDPLWPEDRIGKILQNHEKFAWSVPTHILKDSDRKVLWESVKAYTKRGIIGE